MAAYCPSSQDIGFDYNGGSSIFDQGWTIRGGARVHTNAAYNLLGGGVEFDYDVTGGHTGQNNNLYTISPDLHGGAYSGMNDYCDGQAPNGKFCMELDIIESNGNCGGAVTWHTVPGHPGGCDGDGCQALFPYNGKTKMHVRAEFDNSGVSTVYVGDDVVGFEQMNPHPTGSDAATVQSVMKSVGVVFASSQWTGWCPTCNGGTGGDLESAVFSVSNLRITGSIVSGPEPRRCSDQPPPPSSPTPTPTPPSSPTPTPPSSCPGSTSECDCSWTAGCANCGHDDGGSCYQPCCGSSPSQPAGPTPAPPTMPPPSGKGSCRWGGCSGNGAGGWCSTSREHCEESCAAIVKELLGSAPTWCPEAVVAESALRFQV